MRNLLPVIFLLSLFSCDAQQSARSFTYEHRQASDTSVPAPVVILLHGYGGDEKGIFTLASRIPAGYHVFALRAPLTLRNGGYGWFNLRFPFQRQISYDYIEMKHRRTGVLRFISHIGQRYRVDTTRIVLVGYSQGGLLALDLAASFSRKFPAAASLSGGMLPETRQAARTARFPRLNAFIGYGIFDQVVDYHLSIKARDFLLERGAKVTFRKYEAKHEIPPEEVNDLESWLTELLLVTGG